MKITITILLWPLFNFWKQLILLPQPLVSLNLSVFRVCPLLACPQAFATLSKNQLE
jgi:hypothetical protein